jgi:hypothetical protein
MELSLQLSTNPGFDNPSPGQVLLPQQKERKRSYPLPPITTNPPINITISCFEQVTLTFAMLFRLLKWSIFTCTEQRFFYKKKVDRVSLYKSLC